MTQYRITIRDEKRHPASLDRRLRIALKRMLRSLGLRVTEIRPAKEQKKVAPGDCSRCDSEGATQAT